MYIGTVLHKKELPSINWFTTDTKV